eukprot:g38921.t1
MYDTHCAHNAMRTPTRNDAGIELLMEYYNQLYFIDNRFFPPNKNMGIFFHCEKLDGIGSQLERLSSYLADEARCLFLVFTFVRFMGGNCLHALSTKYDSLTGVPSYQRALAFEKGSILFNIGALYTQIGARQDRTTEEGINRAIDAFQKAA